MTIRVAEYMDPDKTEAVVEICHKDVSIYAFSYPHRELPQGGNVLLRAFLTENIWLAQEFCAPRKLDEKFFAYRLTARVVDAPEQKVQIGDITILLDRPLPKDIPNGVFVSFDVMRLDVEFES